MHNARWKLPVGCAALCALMALGWHAPASAASAVQGQLAAALAVRPNLTHGAQLFAFCAGCHGVDGGGSADGTVPAIAAQAPRVLLRQLLEYRVAMRSDLRMSAVAHTQRLPDAQALADVAAYVGSLPAAVRSAGKRAPGSLSPGARAFADGTYTRLCAGCHGELAQGSGDAPRLAGQRYPFLLQRLTDAAAGRVLQPVHGPLLGGLQPNDLAAVAAYLAQLRAPGR